MSMQWVERKGVAGPSWHSSLFVTLEWAPLQTLRRPRALVPQPKLLLIS